MKFLQVKSVIMEGCRIEKDEFILPNSIVPTGSLIPADKFGVEILLNLLVKLQNLKFLPIIIILIFNGKFQNIVFENLHLALTIIC